jgi:IS30 family transposase
MRTMSNSGKVPVAMMHLWTQRSKVSPDGARPAEVRDRDVPGHWEGNLMRAFSLATAVPVYFARPHSPWERATIDHAVSWATEPQQEGFADFFLASSIASTG